MVVVGKKKSLIPVGHQGRSMLLRREHGDPYRYVACYGDLESSGGVLGS